VTEKVRIALIVVVTLAGLTVAAARALAGLPPKQPTGIGIRLAHIPAAQNQDPLTRSYIVNRLAPGTNINRRVEIINGTHSSARIAIYVAAASLHRGTFAFTPGHNRNELSSWTSVNQAVLQLPPGGRAFETVAVQVPKRASAGERYAVVWAEVAAPPRGSGGVTLVNRVGVRMYLSVGSGGLAPPSFTIGPLTAERSATGQPLIAATIHNTSKRTLEIHGTLTLANGPGGLRAGPLPVTIGARTTPDGFGRATVRLDKQLPIGPWHVQMLLRSGHIQREADATLSFPRRATTTRPSHSLLLPLIVTALIGSTLILLAREARRRHPRRRAARQQ
jgi:hypothetical protein